ncbi:Abi family protein [Peptococcus simiae]|uniref:Abi family protein n=1 Tax=Peptococcus simiae TaxID=1643805 RepID=A0ABW9H0H1_9FIRM
MKVKKTAKELIQHMKNKQITFSTISEEDAEHFLSEHSYYLKFASYRKNYEKRSRGDLKGTYVNLDFSYLKDLSTIDMHLKYQVIHMCLDIEHGLRTFLIHDVESNDDENGYDICSSFLNAHPQVQDNIKRYRNTSYCARLIDKYQAGYPIWVLCEIISFGELVNLYKFYHQKYPDRKLPHPDILYSVRNIRNAAAHNNCLLNDLHHDVSTSQFKPNVRLTKLIRSEMNLGKDGINKKMSNQMIHDFIALLVAYNTFVGSELIKSERLKALDCLFVNRMLRNKSFYENNELIKSAYQFCYSILDFFIKKLD